VTTQFIDASRVVQSENNNTRNDIDNLDYIHSIVNILNRPSYITEFTLDASSAPLTATGPQTPLFTCRIPLDVMTAGNKGTKIQNFAYFRCTTVVKVMVNANPLTNGKLWVCFSPQESRLLPAAQLLPTGRPCVTAYPGVEIDLQINNVAEIRIPWTYPEECMHPWEALNDTPLYVFAMGPIQGPAGFAVNCQVFGWLEDVVLRGPTYRVRPLVVEEGTQHSGEYLTNLLHEVSNQVSLLADISQLKDENYQPDVTQVDNCLLSLRKAVGSVQNVKRSMRKQTDVGEQHASKPQAQQSKEKPTSTSGAREAPGPVQKVAGIVSKVANFAKGIPIIGQFAGPVEWAADIAGGIASIFGWSRPVAGSGAPPISNIPGRGMAQTMCEDQAVVLGYNNDNKLATNEVVFLREEDEMDIQFIAGKPSLVSVTPFKTTSTRETMITHVVGPMIDTDRAIWDPNAKGHAVDVHPTCFENIALLCSNWRADLHFRVSVAKTAFHTGRLELIYVPGVDRPPSSFDATNCYRTILDLSRQNEVEFVIPFVSKWEMNNVTVSETSGVDGNIGWFIIKPLTPLLCPETVSQEVSIYVWKFATNVSLAGTARTAIRGPPSPSDAGSQHMEVGIDHSTEKFVCFGSVNSNTTNIDVAKRVCGEQLTNARQLTRAHRLSGYVLAETRTEIPSQIAVAPGVVTDYLTAFAQMYVYFKGGLSYKFINVAGDSYSGFVNTSLIRTYPGDDKLPFDHIGQANSTFHYTDTNINPIHEVMVPYYSKTSKALVSEKLENFSDRIPSLLVTVTKPNTDMRLMRAGKDDFSFGCLVGVKPFRMTQPTIPTT
jgi:hypothetical protein